MSASPAAEAAANSGSASPAPEAAPGSSLSALMGAARSGAAVSSAAAADSKAGPSGVAQTTEADAGADRGADSSQGEHSPEWRRQKRHFFILTHAGVPSAPSAAAEVSEGIATLTWPCRAGWSLAPVHLQTTATGSCTVSALPAPCQVPPLLRDLRCCVLQASRCSPGTGRRGRSRGSQRCCRRWRRLPPTGGTASRASGRCNSTSRPLQLCAPRLCHLLAATLQQPDFSREQVIRPALIAAVPEPS